MWNSSFPFISVVYLSLLLVLVFDSTSFQFAFPSQVSLGVLQEPQAAFVFIPFD